MKILKQKFGFSVIELLIVMVVIGILAGIGLSQFRSHIEKARLAKAKTEYVNFRQKILAEDALAENNFFTAWYSFEDQYFNQTTGLIQDAARNGNDLVDRYAPVEHVSSEITPLGTGKSFLTNTGTSVFRPNNISNYPTNKITISTWVKADDITANRTYITFIGSNTGLSLLQDGSAIFYINNRLTGNYGAVSAPGTIKLGEWHFLVGSYDGQTARLWIDGELVAERNENQTRLFNSGGIFVGYGGFSGNLDEVMFVNKAWNGTEFEE